MLVSKFEGAFSAACIWRRRPEDNQLLVVCQAKNGGKIVTTESGLSKIKRIPEAAETTPLPEHRVSYVPNKAHKVGPREVVAHATHVCDCIH